MIARPLNCGLGHLVEIAGRFDQRSLLIMIAFDDRAIHLADARDALMRVGVVTDHVAETNEVGALVLPRVGEHGLERFKVGMNVTENREAHWVVNEGLPL
jgi:hypothetical protein